jgi:hypothetical protein
VEKALEKLARQLAAFDEASLMALWDKYARTVGTFEPSKRWEEAVIIFGFIQSVRFKNQLFNFHWSAAGVAGEPEPVVPGRPVLAGAAAGEPDRPAPKRGKVLRFPGKDEG